MTLVPGARIGPYEITGTLGAGGMGEVYRAHDPRLHRDLALKVLPPAVATDRDRITRFLREAEAASALNHPHIVAIHESGEADGTRYIAMELVDGEPLTSWCDKTAPDLGRVLDVFLQLADALTMAHQAGIVHRDLKPANVLVTAQGYVKVVDFGLAKVVGAVAPAADVTAAATATALGEVMGTVSYMAPEQALGRVVDARSDIFSFGVMLFEALCGARPFERPSSLDTLHAIVHDEPHSLQQRQGRPLPRELDWMLGKCLAKDPEERYQSMRDLAADLRRIRRQASEGSGRNAAGQAGLPTAASGPGSRDRRFAPWAVAPVFGFLGLAVGAGLLVLLGPSRESKPLPPLVSAVTQLTWDTGYEGEPSWAPDGLSLAYSSDRGGDSDIYLSQVSGGPAVNLTNDPSDDVQPAFSPDGKQIAFVSSRRGRPLRYSAAESPRFGGSIFVMSALGGAARYVAEGNFPSWTSDGKALVFVAGAWFERRLYTVPVTGGTPTLIPVKMDATFEARAAPGVPQDLLAPACSPDGRLVAFEALRTVYVVPIEGGSAVAIAEGQGPAWVSSPLALVYTAAGRASGESLWRVPVAAADGRPSGPPEPITVGRGQDVQAAVSRDGRSIAFAAVDTTSNIERLAFDLDGARAATAAPVPVTAGNDRIYFFHSSPDGRTVVYESLRTRGIWASGEGRPQAQLSADPSQADSYPRWSPDGRRIVFSRRPRAAALSARSLWIMEPDGSNPRPLGLAAFNGFVSWTPDARSLVLESASDRQLHLVGVDSKADTPLTSEEGVMPVTAVSPDGAWVVYQSVDRSSRIVVLRALRPTDGQRSQVVVSAQENSYHPFFSPSGSWLYFTPDHQSIYRVPGPAQQWRKAAPDLVITFPGSGVFIEDPQAAGDGRSILYARRTLTSDLWMLTLKR